MHTFAGSFRARSTKLRVPRSQSRKSTVPLLVSAYHYCDHSQDSTDTYDPTYPELRIRSAGILFCRVEGFVLLVAVTHRES
jgi:hypothetical protein